MLVFNNVVYNASLHSRCTTKKIKFLRKIFAVVMSSYPTFATAKVKIKLPPLFFVIPIAAN